MNFPPGLLRIQASLRAFARAPALSFALVSTIALGVGSNAAVYAFVQGLVHPGSLPGIPDGIVSVLEQDRSRDLGPPSLREYQSLKKDSGPFDWIDAVRIAPGHIAIGSFKKIAIVAEIPPNLAAAFNLPLHGLHRQRISRTPRLARQSPDNHARRPLSSAFRAPNPNS